MINDIVQQIKTLKNKLFTGSLCIKLENDLMGKLFFRLGRISWIAGGVLPVERWQRYVQSLSLDVTPEELNKFLSIDDAGQQYELLCDLQETKLLTTLKIRNFISQIIPEFLLDLIIHNRCLTLNSYTLDLEVTTINKPSKILCLIDPLNLIEEVNQELSRWNIFESQGIVPTFYPAINKLDALVIDGKLMISESLISSINYGNNNLRQLSYQLKTNPLELADKLEPLVKNKAIIFYSSPKPTKVNSVLLNNFLGKNKQNQINSIEESEKKLIACVDDSKLICQNLEEVIKKGGYEFIGIQHSIKAIPLLLKNKPNFIFLDLMMPVINGYELCERLRKIPIFKQIPIVILTGKDGLIDRMRSKMVGATDFISKPIVEEEVINTISKHIQIEK